MPSHIYQQRCESTVASTWLLTGLSHGCQEGYALHPFLVTESRLSCEIMQMLNYPLQEVFEPGVRTLRIDQFDIVRNVINGQVLYGWTGSALWIHPSAQQGYSIPSITELLSSKRLNQFRNAAARFYVKNNNTSIMMTFLEVVYCADPACDACDPLRGSRCATWSGTHTKDDVANRTKPVSILRTAAHDGTAT